MRMDRAALRPLPRVGWAHPDRVRRGPSRPDARGRRGETAQPRTPPADHSVGSGAADERPHPRARDGLPDPREDAPGGHQRHRLQQRWNVDPVVPAGSAAGTVRHAAPRTSTSRARPARTRPARPPCSARNPSASLRGRRYRALTGLARRSDGAYRASAAAEADDRIVCGLRSVSVWPKIHGRDAGAAANASAGSAGPDPGASWRAPRQPRGLGGARRPRRGRAPDRVSERGRGRCGQPPLRHGRRVRSTHRPRAWKRGSGVSDVPRGHQHPCRAVQGRLVVPGRPRPNPALER